VSGDFQLGPWLVRPSVNTITNNGTTVRLEPKVMEVLVCLAQHAGEPVSKEAIIKTVWADAFVSDDALTRSVSELRRALDDNAREPVFVETIPKRGYRILLPVRSVAPESSPQAVFSDTGSTGINSIAVRICLLVLGATIVVAGIVFGLNVGGLRSRFTATPAPLTIRALAVLPLQNLSTDPVQEYFSEGMTDALITDLAQISALKVVSRTTIMRYGRPDKPLSQIARELNVDGIVEGTVQRSGDRVRITAQLIYGPTDQHIWASSFDRDVKDMLALQGEVASEIARQVQVKILPEEQARLNTLRPVNPKALEYYDQARFHLDGAAKLEYHKGKRGILKEHLRQAEAYLDRALDEDPRFMPAYAALWDLMDETDAPRVEFLPKAKSTLKRGLELDDTNAELHIALARILIMYDFDWAAADREYRRAIELSPKSSDAHFQYSEYLQNVGANAEGAKELTLAQELNPARDYLSDGIQRVGRTLEQQRQVLEEQAPDDPYELGVMGKNYAIAGRFKESVEMWERCSTLYGWRDFADGMKRAHARGGPKFALEEWMRAAEEYSKSHDDFPLIAAVFTYASLGNKDRAFAWLDKAVAQRSWCLMYLKRDTVFDPLRSDPRFGALLRRVGLSP
jgi:TolB-like protein/DNA-binding winged helix-turn-helix (wHTH) protein/tetratricopeptide (TPR) repeat protein